MPCYTTLLFVRCINKLGILCIFRSVLLYAFSFRSNAELSQTLLAWKMCMRFLLLLAIISFECKEQRVLGFWVLALFFNGFSQLVSLHKFCFCSVLPFFFSFSVALHTWQSPDFVGFCFNSFMHLSLRIFIPIRRIWKCCAYFTPSIISTIVQIKIY